MKIFLVLLALSIILVGAQRRSLHQLHNDINEVHDAATAHVPRHDTEIPVTEVYSPSELGVDNIKPSHHPNKRSHLEIVTKPVPTTVALDDDTVVVINPAHQNGLYIMRPMQVFAPDEDAVVEEDQQQQDEEDQSQQDEEETSSSSESSSESSSDSSSESSSTSDNQESPTTSNHDESVDDEQAVVVDDEADAVDDEVDDGQAIDDQHVKPKDILVLPPSDSTQPSPELIDLFDHPDSEHVNAHANVESRSNTHTQQ